MQYARVAHLAVDRRVAESTQNQALGAILFLFRQCLARHLFPCKGSPSSITGQ
jgi:hypothetical protein